MVGHTIPILCGAACLPVVYLLTRRFMPSSATATTFFVATIAPFVCWTFGGLEAPIFSLASLLAVLAWGTYLRQPDRRAWVLTVLAMLAFSISRPEVSLVLLACGIASLGVAFLRERRAGRTSLRALAPEVGVFGAVAFAAAVTAAAHYAIGGHVIPNPARAKGHVLEIVAGLGYLNQSLRWVFGWAVLAYLAGIVVVARRALVRTRRQTRTELPLALLSLAYLGFIVCTGGDWMWGGRFFSNIAPLFGIVTVFGFRAYLPRKWLAGRRLLVWLLVGNIAPTFITAFGTRTGRPVWRVEAMQQLVRHRYPKSRYDFTEVASGVNLRDIPVTETLRMVLQQVGPLVAPGPVIVASRQAGFTMFHIVDAPHPDVRFVDLHNLATDDYLDCGGPYLKRNTHGALLPYEDVLNPSPDLKQRCTIVRPHVIFDAARGQDPTEVVAAGYTIVFMQRGLPGKKPWWVGHYAEFIAVDNDLAQKAGLQPRTVDCFDFDWMNTASFNLFSAAPP
jgi:hypothetical protein